MKRSHDAAMGGDSDDDRGGSLFVEDDDTDKVPPYDAKKEALPDCKIFTPEYKFIIDGKGKISNLVDAPFQESTFRSGPTEGLQEDHRRRVKDRSSAKIKIGVVGDMSSGKLSNTDARGFLLTMFRQELRSELSSLSGSHCAPGIRTQTRPAWPMRLPICASAHTIWLWRISGGLRTIRPSASISRAAS